MSDIIAGDPADTNPTAQVARREEAKRRLRAQRDAELSLPASERVANLLQVTHTATDTAGLIDAIRAEGRAEALAEAQARLDETYRLAPVPGTADGINYAVGILMSLRGESRG
jgi:hypothetical protein